MIAEAAEQAEAELHRLYWAECDAVQAALDPEALGAGHAGRGV